MIIGLTGSIASGKSTVSAMLAEMGYPIVDADKVARLVVEPGSETLEKIRVLFGEEVILPDGTMDRKKVGELIFNDPASRKKLNDVIHPAIRMEMLRQRGEFLDQGFETVIMDIPLLFESRLQHLVDKVLVVSVTEEHQLKRLMERNGLSEKEARARIASQLPMSVKEEGADAVIYNNGSVDETKWQLNRILDQWKRLQSE
ncbi:dephospho-CoA kinase [Planococcus glaciei]|uniref:Dephospho-CoA kinase n=1 Tax=Planococcus glaciei TaxID=459472 RepID=A0A1G8GYX5_9BACL|nr:dephospho-CoA kinase [Planococcus glaciei]ETP69337.1 dephospho-CoA kinase [Planococcus glaciei CHR43]MBX0315157.1 dephospho-CoA kinase [Planococcus glaciei]QKX51649.1 dephospho-CoA kinase [Planococcus glaciei]SDH99616.1 dephospho-CoA kinase [Planococcus glaciei]